MSGHKDATGYLLALRAEIPYDWFSYACDLALSATDQTVGADNSLKLVALFLQKEKYTPKTAPHAETKATTVRELVRQFPNCQMIIFTHNWDLFVQTQIIFNKAHLSNDMEVKVMENCAIVESYSEKVDDLTKQIGQMLALSGDFDSGQKEKISGLMRRFIESVVNKYVFNGQRHQFKQRGQSVSNFEDYVRLVPLDATEAQRLSDLYGILSISEHDDPRNMYVSRSKRSFQGWYDEIVDIAKVLQSRRPKS
jgi:hypothetical protein